MKDTVEDIYCPACGKKMIKVKAENTSYYVDVCVDGCGGVYFDNREFQKNDEISENIDYILNAYKDKEYMPVDTDKKRVCPCCGTLMVKNFASVKKEVEIDMCYKCGGVFLDYGELEKIRTQYDTTENRINDFKQEFIEQYKDIVFTKSKDYKKQRIMQTSIVWTIFSIFAIALIFIGLYLISHVK